MRGYVIQLSASFWSGQSKHIKEREMDESNANRLMLLSKKQKLDVGMTVNTPEKR